MNKYPGLGAFGAGALVAVAASGLLFYAAMPGVAISSLSVDYTTPSGRRVSVGGAGVFVVAGLLGGALGVGIWGVGRRLL